MGPMGRKNKLGKFFPFPKVLSEKIPGINPTWSNENITSWLK